MIWPLERRRTLVPRVIKTLLLSGLDRHLLPLLNGRGAIVEARTEWLVHDIAGSITSCPRATHRLRRVRGSHRRLGRDKTESVGWNVSPNAAKSIDAALVSGDSVSRCQSVRGQSGIGSASTLISVSGGGGTRKGPVSYTSHAQVIHPSRYRRTLTPRRERHAVLAEDSDHLPLIERRLARSVIEERWRCRRHKLDEVNLCHRGDQPVADRSLTLEGAIDGVVVDRSLRRHEVAHHLQSNRLSSGLGEPTDSQASAALWRHQDRKVPLPNDLGPARTPHYWQRMTRRIRRLIYP